MNDPLLPEPDEVDGTCSCCDRPAPRLWNVMPDIAGMCLGCAKRWRVTPTGRVLRLVSQKIDNTTYRGADGQEA